MPLSEKEQKMIDNCAFASPASFSPECGTFPGTWGMSKREFFAAFAMHAIINNPKGYGCSEDLVAMSAVGYADAMLNELGKGDANGCAEESQDADS